MPKVNVLRIAEWHTVNDWQVILAEFIADMETTKKTLLLTGFGWAQYMHIHTRRDD